MRGVMKMQKGFTATELLIGILILAVVIAVATPFFLSTIKDYRLRAAAWEVAGNLRLARQKAVAWGRPYRFTFNDNAAGTNPNSYIIERQESGGSWTQDPANRIFLQTSGGPTNVWIHTSSHPSGGVITIQATGTVSPAGTIRLVDSRNKEYTVVINVVGRVSVNKI